MLPSFLSLIIVILFHVLSYIDLIPVEIFIGITELILISTILRYLWFKRKMEMTRWKHGKFKIPVRPKASRPLKNKYLARWKNRHLKCSVLPLNRIAYLKARYRIGPYKSHKYADEVSISFLKSQAEKSHSMQPENDECHPICYVNEYTESYIQYRALLYVQQAVQNIGEKHQRTFKSEESDANIAPESTMPNMQARYTAVPETIEEDIRRMRRSHYESLAESEKWDDFEKETEKARQNIREIEWMFKVMKHGQKNSDKNDFPSRS